MKIDINIDDYLSEEEKKGLCIEYVKEALRSSDNSNHKERVLSNMAYHAAFSILDNAIEKEDLKSIRTKIKKIISNPSSYSIFRKKDAWGKEDSVAYLEVKSAIKKHKGLIDDLVKNTILQRDYEKDIDSDILIESVISIFKRGLETNGR